MNIHEYQAKTVLRELLAQQRTRRGDAGQYPAAAIQATNSIARHNWLLRQPHFAL